MRKGLLACAVVLAFATTWGPATAQDVPTLYLYVNDLTQPGALFSDEIQALDDLCFQVDDLTSAEVAILLVNTTAPMGMNLFAVETFEANGIGKEGLDNGVLIVLATDDREWRIEVGYGLQGILPNAFVGRVGVDNITPHLDRGDYFSALYEATWTIGQQIVDRYDPGGAAEGTPQLIVIDWWAVGVSVAVFLGVAFLTKGRGYLWLGNLFKRGGFGGGRSGGGGARGKY